MILCVLAACCPVAFAVSVTDFADVSSGEWFYSSVKFVTDKGMFNGTDSNTFSPNGTMTRGMFVTVLGRYSNAPNVPAAENMGIVTATDVNMRRDPTTNSAIVARPSKNTQVEILETVTGTSDSSYQWYKIIYNNITGYIREDLMMPTSSDFTDVPDGAYYSGYVQWAYTNGIAGKTGDSTFSPERAITREEICSMLNNLADYKHLSPKYTVAAVTFSDSGSISSSYAASVSMMQRIGVINGYEDGSFRPKGSATRAEVSAMLERFISAISYKPIVRPSIDASGNYIWGTEVPQKAAVGDSYFSDSCFIGHSIVVGMKNTFGLSNADFYAFNGAVSGGAYSSNITTYKGFPLSTTHTDEDGNEVNDTGTLKDCLKENSYGKVYIMLGTNEVGSDAYHEQVFYNNMSSLIDMVRSTQPNAIIYLFSLTPVSQECSESRTDLTRDNIIDFNAVISELCKDKKVYYLNVFDLLVNEDGFLPKSASLSDGIHILSSEYAKIKNYVFSHTV